jgi:hypothetical protein
MELIVEPDIYSPNIDDKGNYVDKIPSFNNIKNGVRCPCGTRKDKTYDCTAYFSRHIKTKIHQKWLEELNLNKLNYFAENIVLKETINNQKLIIAKMEKVINDHKNTIIFLTKKIELREKQENGEIDLLNFD